MLVELSVQRGECGEVYMSMDVCANATPNMTFDVRKIS